MNDNDIVLSDIFSIKIYETKYPDFYKIKQSIIENLEPHYNTLAEGNEYWDKDGKPLIYRTPPNLEKDNNFKDLIEWVEYHGKKYWKELGLTSRVEPFVLHAWSNKLKPGGFTPVHVHTPMPIASAFYINADDEMGVLEIENPIDTILKLNPKDNALVPHFDTHKVPIEDGKLVLFPGWLRHFTRSNMSMNDRIIVSFNIGANVSYHGKND